MCFVKLELKAKVCELVRVVASCSLLPHDFEYGYFGSGQKDFKKTLSGSDQPEITVFSFFLLTSLIYFK